MYDAFVILNYWLHETLLVIQCLKIYTSVHLLKLFVKIKTWTVMGEH